jgi:hypothetical protein
VATAVPFYFVDVFAERPLTGIRLHSSPSAIILMTLT